MSGIWLRLRAALTAAIVVIALGSAPGAFERIALAPAVAPLPAEPASARDASLTLSVTTEAGAPLQGARVVVMTVRAGVAYETARAVTDAGGKAILRELPGGDAWVLVNADGRARASSHLLLEGARQLVLALAPEAHFDVLVRDPEGQPVAGAAIEATAAEPLPVGATTDAEGRARVGRLGAGPWRVEIRAPGYDTARERATGGETLAVTLRRLGSILVRVVDGEGRPVPGARVQIAGASLWPAREGKTGEKGMVKLAGLYAGAYALRATQGGNASATELALPLAAGENKELVLAVRPGRMVHVRVVTGDEGADAPPVAGARIVLAEGGLSPFPLEAVSDARGAATLGPIAAGASFVSARAEGYVGGGGALVAEPLTGEIVVALAKAGTLGGRVTDARGFPIAGVTLEVIGSDFAGGPIDDDPRARAFRDAHFDAVLPGPSALVAKGELGVVPGPVPPIPRANERVMGFSPPAAPASGAPWASAKDGTFAIGPVTPGRVRVLARHPEYVEALSEIVTLASGGRVDDVTIVLRAGGSIEGRVVAASGAAVAGARVELIATRGTFSRQTHTASDGTFAFSAVPDACTVDVYVSDAALQPSARVGAVVPEGGRRELTIRLPTARDALTVTVRDDRGYPLAAAQLTLLSLDPGEPLRETAFTDARGDASLAGCVGLPARLEVRAPGHAPKALPQARTPAHLDITVDPALSVRGEVRASRGNDSPAATIVFYTELGPRSVAALADGSFAAQELSPGSARVLIRAPGFARLEKSLTLKASASGRPVDIGRFELSPEARVTGTVLSARGQPVQGARVSEGHAPTFLPQGAPPPGVAITDARGRFDLGELSAGNLSLEAWGPDDGTGAVMVQTAAGRATSDVRITLGTRAPPSREPATTGGVAVTLGERSGEPREVVIVSVAQGSEAERAGLAPGDAIVTVDDAKVATIEEARARLSGPIERDVIVRLSQGGKERVVRVSRERVRR